MRANEFVANKIYQESKLFEDDLSDFFQIEEIRVEGEKKFRLKFGPDDTEGELFDTRREAQQAKREQIRLARNAKNKFKQIGDDPNFLKRVYKGSKVWLLILGATGAFIDWTEYSGRLKDMYTYLKFGTNLCQPGGRIGSIMASDTCAMAYAKNCSFALTNIFVSLLEAVAAGSLALGTFLAMAKWGKAIPIPIARLAVIIVWLGTEAGFIAIQTLLSEKWQARWVSAVDEWLYFNHILVRPLHQAKIEALCDTRRDYDLARPDGYIRVQQTGCGINESESLNTIEVNEATSLSVDLESLWSRIFYEDETLRDLLQKAKEKQDSGAKPINPRFAKDLGNIVF